MTTTTQDQATDQQTDTWLWDTGHYESTGEELLGYARTVVDRADPRPGERVLDIGTGTGNAALLCARRGANATGVDLARRLMGVARERARAADLSASWVYGDAHALPFLDDDFDVVVSVSALVLVPEPVRSAAELVRVLRPGGRAVIGGWDWDDSPMFPDRLAGVFAEALEDPGVLGMREEDPGWFGEAKVRRLFADLPVHLEVERRPYSFGGSERLDDLVGRFTEDHPMVVGARERLGDERWQEFVSAFRDWAGDNAAREEGGYAMQQTALIAHVTKDA